MRNLPLKLAALAVCFVSLVSTTPDRLGDPDSYRQVYLPFYAQPVPITFDPDMVVEGPEKMDNPSIRGVVSRLERKPLAPLLNSLLTAKRVYGLNDFLFFQLARKSVSDIYDDKRQNAQEITLYQLLVESGFDARLTFRGQRVYLNVYTQEPLFEVPIIDADGRPYANLSCLDGQCSGRQRLYIFNDHPNPRGPSFGFQLREWPKLARQPTTKKLRFNYHGSTQEIDVQFDRTVVDIMADYPFIHEYCYLETPLSTTLSESLLPQLRGYMEHLDTQQQLELLASFTRSAFAYMEDNEFFGRSKPMVPEEVFGYSYSDCEDRSALFFALVRELMGLPMAVVAYDDHLTVAVAADEVKGDSFEYRGRRYIFCDPTGPKNSSRIGQIPPGYEGKRFSIIGTYN